MTVWTDLVLAHDPIMSRLGPQACPVALQAASTTASVLPRTFFYPVEAICTVSLSPTDPQIRFREACGSPRALVFRMCLEVLPC